MRDTSLKHYRMPVAPAPAPVVMHGIGGPGSSQWFKAGEPELHFPFIRGIGK